MRIATCFQRLASAFLMASVAASTSAQIATVDATDPTDPELSYDEDPYLHAPELPEHPTDIYGPDVPSDPTTAGAGTALGAANIVTATSGNTTGEVTSQQPVVKTAEPDTHSLSRATVYYTPPDEPAGPHKQLSGMLKFDFGTQTSAVAPGYTRVHERTLYSAETGYGWSTGAVISRDRGLNNDPLARDWCLPNERASAPPYPMTVPSPTQFLVDVPDGTYRVAVLTGDTLAKPNMSVWAEGLPQISLGAAVNQTAEGWFPVTVDDGRLTLEFFGAHRPVNAIVIERIPDDAPRKTTIFLAGDSTVCDYGPNLYPMRGWGARLADYFTDDIAIDNRALAGRSSKSFVEERQLETIANRIRPGDYLFVMFAINDSADDNSNRKTRPESTFKAYLRLYVEVARENEATPVLVTSQTKRTYDAWGRFTNSVGAYPQAMRELGEELDVPVIDLNRESIDYLTAIGPEAAKDVYMFLDRGQYPGWPNGAADYIHLQDNGAKQFARLVTQEIRELDLEPLADYVRPDIRP